MHREAEPNRIVEEQLVNLAKALEAAITPEADVLAFIGAIYSGADTLVREALEAKPTKRDRLYVVLETGGGFIETAERIADILRHHYPKRVEFLVPDYAMSAGTVLVMSGDDIHMDYYSVLGPVDPQVERRGRFVPALGYLEKFAEFVDKSKRKDLTEAELMFMIDRFDPAELHEFEQARELSKTLLQKWLANRKFKDWTKTEGRGIVVDQKMREDRATEIAEKLNDTKRWHTHARGISREVLVNDLNLKIPDFGSNKALSEKLRVYHKALVDYGAVMGLDDNCLAVHTTEGYRWRR